MRKARSGHVLATLMFTDIVDSTRCAKELGDRRWRVLLARHHQVVRRAIKRHHGAEIDDAGDGFFVRFDDQVDAIRCACLISDEVTALGIEVRAGCHVGQAEVQGGKLRGVTVHAAARVMSQAGPSEVLVSSMLKELVPASGFTFADRGAYELKGIEGEWHLYAVTAVDGAPRPERPDPDELAQRREAIKPPPIIERRSGRVAIAACALVVIFAAAAFITHRPQRVEVQPNSLVTDRSDDGQDPRRHTRHAAGRGPTHVRPNDERGVGAQPARPVDLGRRRIHLSGRHGPGVPRSGRSFKQWIRDRVRLQRGMGDGGPQRFGGDRPGHEEREALTHDPGWSCGVGRGNRSCLGHGGRRDRHRDRPCSPEGPPGPNRRRGDRDRRRSRRRLGGGLGQWEGHQGDLASHAVARIIAKAEVSIPPLEGSGSPEVVPATARPSRIAVARDGSVWVSDNENGVVYKIDPFSYGFQAFPIGGFSGNEGSGYRLPRWKHLGNELG